MVKTIGLALLGVLFLWLVFTKTALMLKFMPLFAVAIFAFAVYSLFFTGKDKNVPNDSAD